MRQALVDAGEFDWTAIAPAIFGALFQSVMEPADRRTQPPTDASHAGSRRRSPLPSEAFVSKRERVEYLFTLYERMQVPLATAAAKPKVTRQRRVT